jgi:hypothetical protein
VLLPVPKRTNKLVFAALKITFGNLEIAIGECGRGLLGIHKQGFSHLSTMALLRPAAFALLLVATSVDAFTGMALCVVTPECRFVHAYAPPCFRSTARNLGST